MTDRTVASKTYLPGMTIHDYQLLLKEQHPALLELLDPNFAAVAEEPWVAEGNEFDDDDTGRGGSYRNAQRHGEARRTGISALLGMLGGPDPAAMGLVLDVLGGEGLLSRVWRVLAGVPDTVAVPLITGDISGGMVAAALRSGLPAVRQPADRLLLRDGVLDGVLIAYGTHHIPRAQRPGMAEEAWRVLGPDGRVVVHDFAQDSPVARWFSQVVHPLSRAGHDYDHFTGAEMAGYLITAGFVDVRVDPMYDPIVFTADTPEAALAALVSYMTDMYGLAPPATIVADPRSAGTDIERLLRETFRFDPGELPTAASGAVTGLTVRPSGARFSAELPRMALVANGRKA